MLVQFRFKNFKSFRDEAVLDLSAAKMTEFSERVVSIGGERLLRTAASPMFMRLCSICLCM